jgi:DNA-binding GntR family transcriptional regulator
MVQKKTKAKESLVDTAHRKLEERFITLKLPPGSVWSEEQLSALINIGRTPVREAILRMAADHLVDVIKRAGVVIADISIQDQLIVLETRRELEALVSSRAARRAIDSERAYLHKLADQIEDAGAQEDVKAYLTLHFEIKHFVSAAARNPYAERALTPLHTLSERFYFMYHREIDNLKQVGKAHAELTRAIANGEEQAAARMSVEINDTSEKFTKALLMRDV